MSTNQAISAPILAVDGGCDATVSGDTATTATSAGDNEVCNLVRSELLCFVVEKSRLLPFDDVVKVCSDFYKEDEILLARRVLEQSGDGSRLSRRQGPSKLRSTMEDIVKHVLDPQKTLPVYYATDLTRLPPVGIKHCDVSAILAELQALRAEVRDIRRVDSEVAELKEQVAVQSTEIKALHRRVDDLCSQRQYEMMSSNVVVSQDNDGSTSDTVQDAGINERASSFAKLAGDLHHTGMKNVVRRNVKSAEKVVAGASTTNRHLSSVHTSPSVDTFVLRLDTDTVVIELSDCYFNCRI